MRRPSYLLNNLRNFNENSEKDVAHDRINIHKKKSFTLSLENNFFQNPQSGDHQIEPPAFLELNHKIPVVFHNLKNYDLHIIMHELCKFILEVFVISNGLEKCMSFNVNNRSAFINCFQFLSSSSES